MIKCYFCQKETIHFSNYYGCLHAHKRRGKMHIRHFYTFDIITNVRQMYEVIWTFKYKRRKYEMVYWFAPTVQAILYRVKDRREIVASFKFIPNWTPENCQEKLSKVLALI